MTVVVKVGGRFLLVSSTLSLAIACVFLAWIASGISSGQVKLPICPQESWHGYRPACLRLCGLCCLGAAQGKGLDRQRALASPDIIWFAFASLKYIITMYSVSMKRFGQVDLCTHLFSNYSTGSLRGTKNPTKVRLGRALLLILDTSCRLWPETKEIVFNNFTRLCSQRT